MSTKKSKASNKRKIIDYFVKGKEIFIGLEDSKTTWVICVRSEKQEVYRGSMPAKYEGLRAFLRRRFPDCTVNLVYEAGFKGFNLYFDLVVDGHKCVVVPPHTVQVEKCAKVKTDRIDARILAKNLEDGNCKACTPPDKERIVDRQVARTHVSVIRKITRVKNQIRKALDFNGIDSGITKSNWTNKQYQYVKGLLPSLETGLRVSLETYFEELELYCKQEKRLLAILKELMRKERYAKVYEIASSLPGIGELTALRLILELGEDFSRFSSGAKIAAFVGLGGTEYSSGDTQKRGGISKQGSRMIRSWLIESSWTAVVKDPAMREFYARIRSNTGNRKKAIVAVARKLVTRLRSCIVNNVEYKFGVIE
jgi:transposase